MGARPGSSDPFGWPVFINCRDRVTVLRELVGWLEAGGHRNIVLVDNDSTYPPLLAYYKQTPHRHIRLGRNLGARAVWEERLHLDRDPFIYTDPDVMPTGECPSNAVEYLWELLERHPAYDKAALGLHLDDVPDTLPSLAWEHALLTDGRRLSDDITVREVEPGVFSTLSDTTFALHRPGADFGYCALRTTAPYQVRHIPWYTTTLDAEQRYYLARAAAGPLGSSWAGQIMSEEAA